MKRPLDMIRRSLSARLSIWVVLFSALILLSTLGYSSLLPSVTAMCSRMIPSTDS